ncbi:MAG: sigma-70 family RNA polymerase sigma factor, partial [Candidatus Jordarchaeales archaeon]
TPPSDYTKESLFAVKKLFGSNLTNFQLLFYLYLYFDNLEKLGKEELQAVIAETLEALPADCRAVLLLCDMEEMSYQQVAEALGVKYGTVGSRLCRARQLFAFYFTRRYKSLLR